LFLVTLLDSNAKNNNELTSNASNMNGNFKRAFLKYLTIIVIYNRF
jgi:hypothetical protein